jgi:predicted RNA binding protein YcfA (HicA-like mRNA interferase family)
MKPLKYREIISCLGKLGFKFYRQGRGSHELWVRDSDGKVVPVPHKKEIRIGTLMAIIREIELTPDEFQKLLKYVDFTKFQITIGD